MERLSKRSKIYNRYQVYIDGVRHHGSIVDKLAEYEDTELTPQEIENLHNKYSTLLEIYDKLQKERDSWNRDAIQSKAELGEYKIARQQEKCKRCKLEDTNRCKEC